MLRTGVDMEPIQLTNSERQFFGELDMKQKYAKRAMMDVFDMYMDTMSEVEVKATQKQLAIAKKYNLDKDMEYKIDKDSGLMSEYTLSEQEADGYEQDTEKPKTGTLDIAEVEEFLRNSKK
tara:strand:- start:875 stop:1237 length:363 start_codon:yes stop_codon:yes gene_type:complete